jgi:hypothetical protein
VAPNPNPPRRLFLRHRLQHPANALVHRPLLLSYVIGEQIKVRGDGFW